MIQFLVSVRSAEEVPTALAGGADIIDVKEPAAGPLGATSSKVWREVARVVPEKFPLSVALGELLDFPAEIAGSSLTEYRYAKIGLANTADRPQWRAEWKAALESLPSHLTRVAVAYADYATARSLPPREILKVAKQNRCKVFLIDTFEKDLKDVFDFMTGREMVNLFEEAREYKMMAVLAGSLRMGRVGEALEVQPDVVAVRGGVCVNAQRQGVLSEALIRLWKSRLTNRQRGPGSKARFS